MTLAIKQYILTKHEDNAECSVVKFGGGAYYDKNWPTNPLGEDLFLLMTINCNKINKKLGYLKLPENSFISVFSTFYPEIDDERNTIDRVIYYDTESSYLLLKAGFTKVTLTNVNQLQYNKNSFPEKNMDVVLKTYEYDGNETDWFFLGSYIAHENRQPNALMSYGHLDRLMDEYDFVGQICLEDVSEEMYEVWGFYEATGYLFLKKEITDMNDAGFFFFSLS